MPALPDLRTGIIAYVIGIALVALLPDCPSQAVILPLCAVVLTFSLVLSITHQVKNKYAMTVVCFAVGFAAGLIAGLIVAALHGQKVCSSWLPESLQGQKLELTGKVSGLPAVSGPVSRFDFLLTPGGEGLPKKLKRVRLSWFDGPSLMPGQQWRLTVKLRHPRGNSSPGAFDLEAWAAREGIQATGYVKGGQLRYEKEARSLADLRDTLRLVIKEWVEEHVSASSAALLTALLIGDKSAISPEQWQLLNRTGTTHLMVISGLHIGLVAALGYWFAFCLGWLQLLPLKRLPLPRVAAVFSLLAAFLYALLAGFNIPVQRALVMAVVALSGPLSSFRPRVSSLYLAALAVVLSIDPLALTSAGFWYSFMAVAALLLGLSARKGSEASWQRWLKPQWLVFLVLSPMLLFNQQSVSLFSPLINLVAIPLVGGVVVPVSLVALLAGFLFEPLGIFLLQISGELLNGWMQVLSWLDGLVAELPILPAASAWGMILAVIAAILWLLPSALGMRLLAPFLVMPWLFPRLEVPDHGQAHVSVFDVGQGLSVLVRTSGHALLYDTGDAGFGRFTVADQVVVPYLRRAGIDQLDRVIISHGDRDHAGGLAAVDKAIALREVYAGSPLPDFEGYVTACSEGQSWQWDGVRFDVLSGSGSWPKTNDRSCVLKITSSGRSLLLTGDIGKRVESQLVAREELSEPGAGSSLKSDVLLVPHHGSKHSCSKVFLDAVRPDYVVVSAGYRNRFGHPSSEVLERIGQAGAIMASTAESGSLLFWLDQTLAGISGYRQTNRRYWWRQLSL